MSTESIDRTKVFARVTDTIFAVLMSLSFVQYHWLIAPPELSLRLYMLLLAYILVVFSRIGFHLSIGKKAYQNNRRFLVDFLILYAYFLLLTAPGFDEDSVRNVSLMLWSLALIFSGYLLWDYLKMQEHKEKFTRGISISILCLVSSVITIVVYNYIPFEFTVPNILGNSGRDLVFVFVSFGNIFLFWIPKMKLLLGKT